MSERTDWQHLVNVLNSDDLSGEATDAAWRALSSVHQRALAAEAAIQRVRDVVANDGFTVTLPTANWDTQLQSKDDPYREQVVLSDDILQALESDD